MGGLSRPFNIFLGVKGLGELSEEAKAFLKLIVDYSTTYRIEEVEGGYQVVGIRRGKIVWRSPVVSTRKEADRIVAQMVDYGV